MCLGNVVGVLVVLTSSEKLPQVPMEPLESDGHSSFCGTPASQSSSGFCPQLGELPCTEQSEAESQMLQAWQEAAAQGSALWSCPWGTPGSGGGCSARCVIPVVPFRKALRVSCVQAADAAEAGGGQCACVHA